MACGNCGSGKSNSGDTKVKGCQSNGGCSSGGCNRMNVFNWLADLPLSDIGKPYNIVEISFNNGSRKDFYKNDHLLTLDKGSYVTVEGSGGFDVGQISLTGELVKLQMKKYGVKESPEIKRILRLSSASDLEAFENAKAKEKDILIRSRAIAKSLNLDMKIAEAECQADSKKICFFYTADARVDFRELIKVYATEFKAKIEMRQIGARQESGKVGGIGSCGRELCCSSWLTDFKTVNTTSARYQNLSINQAKLSGQCGRLKCCLNFELDTYMDALKIFPENADHLETKTGRAYLIKKDIFRNLIWYGVPGSSRQYPLTLDRVNEILAANAKGEKVVELGFVEIVSSKPNAQKTVDVGFVNDVGQLTLSSLNKSNKKRKPQAQETNNSAAPKNRHNKNQQRAPQQGEGGQPKKPQGAAPTPTKSQGTHPGQKNRDPKEKPNAAAGAPQQPREPQAHRGPKNRAPHPKPKNKPNQ